MASAMRPTEADEEEESDTSSQIVDAKKGGVVTKQLVK